MSDHDDSNSSEGLDVALITGALTALRYKRPDAPEVSDPTAPPEPPRFKDSISNREVLLVVLGSTVIVAGILGAIWLTA